MRGVALAAAMLATAQIARAQDCAEGRERTGGYCCWPEQTFSSVARACVGAPRCPEGLIARAATCAMAGAPDATMMLTVPEGYGAPEPVRAAPPGSVRERESESAPAVSVAAWPSTHAASELHRPGPVHGRDEGLIAAALGLFDTGWVFGWMGAIFDELGHPCGGRSCNSWGFAFVPLVGGIASTTVHIDVGGRSNGGSLVLGILSVLLETAGFIALGVALQNRTTEIGFPRISTDRVVVSVVPGASGALAGLSLEGRY